MTDVTVQNERYSTVANVSTVVDIIGHGSIRNGTTAPVKIFLSAPSAEGLDNEGRLTTYLTGDFDYTPPPGVPRPSELKLAPGEEAKYTLTETGLLTKTLRRTVAWHMEPDNGQVDYADFKTYLDCMDVPIAPPAHGPSIMNTYVPWGQ